MRDPSLHITRSTLKTLLDSLPAGLSTEQQSKWIVEQAKKTVLTHRRDLKLSKKQQEAIIKAGALTDDQIKKFNGIYSNVARSLGGLGVDLVNAYSTSYQLLKEVAKLAYEFVTVFEITEVEYGLKIYCEVGFSLMNKKYNLNKFKYFNSRIGEKYRYASVLAEDSKPKETAYFISLWKAAMKHYGASVDSIEFTTEKNASFVFARQEAELVGCPEYKEWIRAQFEELDYMNSLPEISQFHGEQAVYRYHKWRANQAAKDKKEDTEESIVTQDHANYLKDLGKKI